MSQLIPDTSKNTKNYLLALSTSPKDSFMFLKLSNSQFYGRIGRVSLDGKIKTGFKNQACILHQFC